LRPIGRGYPSDLSDKQWKLIRGLIPNASTGGRPRTTDVRKVLNAILYLTRSGCAWRYLPEDFPPWQTVYWYFNRWATGGVLRKIHDHLVRCVRVFEKRSPIPSVLIIDSQSSKAQWGEQRGWDGFKKVRGRKRSILVDTLGLIHGVRVDSANIKDFTSGAQMLDGDHCRLSPQTTQLAAFYADGGYKAHDFQNALYRRFKVWPTLKVSKKEDVCTYRGNHKWSYLRRVQESNLKPVRWRVERTFGWFNGYRRLSRDYEKKTSVSETMIHLSMILLMLRRLTRPKEAYFRWQ
jgi:putative transposase